MLTKIVAVTVCRHCQSWFSGMPDTFDQPVCPECGKELTRTFFGPASVLTMMDNDAWLGEHDLLGHDVGSVGEFGTIDAEALESLIE